MYIWASLVTQMLKNLPAMQGNLGLIPGLGRSPGGGHGNPLQYSCLENSMDRGAWQATVYGSVKSWTRLSRSLLRGSLLKPYLVKVPMTPSLDLIC